MPTQPATAIDTFPNPEPGHDYIIRMVVPEFTCLCPKTGQPDFATLELEYVPDRLCIELKAFKLYLWSFRDRGAFHEAVTNEIIEHLARTIAPRFMRLTARFNVRGGIHTSVMAERRSPQWRAPAPVVLPGSS
jgi:7-cyano-7-deazaguanine reductase